jgi:hypothetical protein
MATRPVATSVACARNKSSHAADTMACAKTSDVSGSGTLRADGSTIDGPNATRLKTIIISAMLM